MTEGWSGNQFGDLWLGGKVNFTSQYRAEARGARRRVMVKLPTAKDDEEGVGTGKTDFAFDGIVSKEINQRVEVSGFGGFIFRGSPDAVEISNGFRWGFGTGCRARKGLRLTAELTAKRYSDESRGTHQRSLVGEDGSHPALAHREQPAVHASIGLTWQGKRGRVRGRGANWRIGMDGRAEFGGALRGRDGRLARHAVEALAITPACASTCRRHRRRRRHPRRRTREPAADREGACEPCTVEVGRTSTVTGDASDPDGDPLTYKWCAPAGTFTIGDRSQTPWTAPKAGRHGSGNGAR